MELDGEIVDQRQIEKPTENAKQNNAYCIRRIAACEDKYED